MLDLQRLRAPLDLPSRTIAWPVTVYRVRARVREAIDLDPFQRLILDMAHANEDDPARIGSLSGLPRPLVELLMAQLNSQGWLDGHGQITAAGSRRRTDTPTEKVVLGWMLRDDITGQPLPWLGKGAPRYAGAPDGVVWLPPSSAREPSPASWLPLAMVDACRLHHKLQRLSRQGWAEEAPLWQPDEGTMAAAQAASRARPDNIELLDSGDYTELLVDVWAPIHEVEADLVAGCPFGRARDGRRYLHRLQQTQSARDLLTSLNQEAASARRGFLADLADSELKAQLEERLREVTEGRSLPTHLLRELREAEWLTLRAELGRLRPEAALWRLGVVAENILLELRPPRGAKPDEAAAAAFLATIPEGAEDDTLAQIVADRITMLTPEDDEGAVLELPRFLRPAASDLVHTLRQGRWPGWNRVGVTRQLLPFAAAAIQPESTDSLRVLTALQRDRELWRMITTVIGLRNPASHGQGEATPPREKLDRDLERSREAVHRAIRAVFPTVTEPPNKEEE